jgi:hypothetical protein
LVTVLRSASKQVASAFYYDRGRRHGHVISSFDTCMNEANRPGCGSINHQLSFLLSEWEASKQCNNRSTEWDARLSTALDVLARFDHVGVLENLAATVRWIAGQLNRTGTLASNAAARTENVRRRPYNHTDEAERIACSLSEQDTVLYRFAQQVRNAAE